MDKKSRLLVMGKLYFKNKDYKLAESSFIEYLNSSPEDFQALKLLAQTYEFQRDFSKAFDAYERCYLAEPERKGVLLDICRLLLMNDSSLDHIDSKKWLKLATQYFPSNPIVVNLKQSAPILDQTPSRTSIELEVLEKLDSMSRRLEQIEAKLSILSLDQHKLELMPKQQQAQNQSQHQPQLELVSKPQQTQHQPQLELMPKPQQTQHHQPQLELMPKPQQTQHQPQLELVSKPQQAQHQPQLELVSKPQQAQHQPQLGLVPKPQLTQHQPQLELVTRPQQAQHQPQLGLVPKQEPAQHQPKLETPPKQEQAQHQSKLEQQQQQQTQHQTQLQLQPKQQQAHAPPDPPQITPSLFSFGSVSSGANLFADSMKKFNIETNMHMQNNKTREGSDDEDGPVQTEELPIEDTCDMKPIEVKSGEEEEEVLFKERCKLFRFRDKEYKERGLGDIKVLKHRETGKCRLIMRRELINLVCLNCWSCSKVERVRDCQVRFAGLDASDGDPEMTVFLAKFKTSEMTDKFEAHLKDIEEK